jgi:hypothetical protein
MTMNDKKYFTVEEANRLIPQVKAMIDQIAQGDTICKNTGRQPKPSRCKRWERWR